jgi:N utilization substance protein B
VPDDEEERRVGSRRAARERALELLYEAEARDVAPSDLVESLPVAPDPYAVVLASGVGEHQAELDELLVRHSHHWELHRMPMIDRTLLRLGAFELGHRPEVPTAVVLNETVELAKRYSTDDSGRFVNGVLAAIAAELRPQP